MEKGSENASQNSENRKLLREFKEIGLTTDQVIEGVIAGELGVAECNESGHNGVGFVGVETSKKGHFK